MKFHCSDFYDYKKNPRPWIDYGLDEEETIEKYFVDHVQIYDTDVCDDIEIDFVFDNGNAFRLEYSWWIEYNPHWSLQSEKFVESIQLEDARCMKTYRDIMGSPHDARLNDFVV